jgi:hypothetical protein
LARKPRSHRLSTAIPTCPEATVVGDKAILAIEDKVVREILSRKILI